MVSSNDVTITEQGHLIVGNIGVPAVAVPALRAHFAAEQKGDYHEGLEEGIKIGRAERMPEDVQKLVDELRVWAAEPAPSPGDVVPASEIARIARRALAALEAAYSQKVEPEPEPEYKLPGYDEVLEKLDALTIRKGVE